MKNQTSKTSFLIAACAYSAALSAQNTLQKEGNSCIPAHQFAEIMPQMAGTVTDSYGKTSVALGAYERISPDGRFVLRSFSGGRASEVSLIELSADGKVRRMIDTPFSNEAFPVQGTWRYLVDTNGEHYAFESVLRTFGDENSSKSISKNALKPVFKGGMDGFYAAAAELPSPKPDHILIRSLSWPNASGDSQTQGEGALSSRTLEINLKNQKITSDSGFRFHCTARVREDGSAYALPMISVDGQEFAALPQTPVNNQQQMRIFGFGADGRGCEAREIFEFAAGKTIFGFPSASGSAPLAWEYRAQAWWYSRELRQAFNIAPFEIEGQVTQAGYELFASAFPGITRDGRVIYGATLKDCSPRNSNNCKQRAGYIISDPYQSASYQNFLLSYKGSARRQCITHADVEQERQVFAKFHNISSQ